MFGNQPMLSGLASVCANVQTRKSTKIAKPEINVALRPDSLTYLFTCGIAVEALAKRIFNFYTIGSTPSKWVGLNVCYKVRVRHLFEIGVVS